MRWEILRPEEIVERHFGLNDAGMLVSLHAISRRIGQMHGLPSTRQLLEEFSPSTHMPIFGFGDFILRRGELHLAKVDDPVRPIDECDLVNMMNLNLP